MKDKREFIPIIIASIVALIITFLVRMFLPYNEVVQQKQDITMPAIPVVRKVDRKMAEVEVLVSSVNIKEGDKIKLQSTCWKKWPVSSMQNHFIAKDLKGNVMNNGPDYTNAQKMWAKTLIPTGVPITMQMLTNEDPIEKARLEKQKQEEELKKKEESKHNNFVKKGMRAITFPIDSRSGSAASFLSPGELVDIIIINGNTKRTAGKDGNGGVVRYSGIKILAFDSVTYLDKQHAEEAQKTQGEKKKDAPKGSKVGVNDFFSGISGGVSNTFSGGLFNPKNVTLEVSDDRVSEMMTVVDGGGVILCLRNQEEPVIEALTGKLENPDDAKILGSMIGLFGANTVDRLQSEKARVDAEKSSPHEFDMMVKQMNSINESNRQIAAKNKDNGENDFSIDDSKDIMSPVRGENYSYEVVRGRIVGDEKGANGEEPHTVNIYKKGAVTKEVFGQNEAGITK